MLKAISDTSPLLYLYRIGGIDWLSQLFEQVWIPEAVIRELDIGRSRGYDVPDLEEYIILKVANPKSMPSEWLVLDLGVGEMAVIALGLENPERILLLDDMLARRTAKAAGLQVWGTLRVLLEAKSHGLIDAVMPYLNRLSDSGMWMSTEIRNRILKLAGEC